jgi:hypothetical protein
MADEENQQSTETTPPEESIEGGADEKEPEPPESYKRVSLFVAIMLAYSAVITMLAGWETEIGISGLTNDILIAEFNRTEANIISHAEAYLNYTVYGYYLAHQTMSDTLNAEITAESEAPILAQADEAQWLADSNRYFFPGSYLQADGGYDLQRNIEEQIAQIGRSVDLDSTAARDYAREQLARKEYYQLNALILGLSVAILGFETLFYWERIVTRWVLIIVGVGLLFGGTVMYLLNSPDPLGYLGL